MYHKYNLFQFLKLYELCNLVALGKLNINYVNYTINFTNKI